MTDLWELADLTTPWCVHTVATLRIAERVEAGVDGDRRAGRAAACDERALHNVLGHLVSKGVFEEPEPGRFALNDAARAAARRRRSSTSTASAAGSRTPGARSPTYVQTGRPGYAERFGRRSGTTSPRTRSSRPSSTR